MVTRLQIQTCCDIMWEGNQPAPDDLIRNAEWVEAEFRKAVASGAELPFLEATYYFCEEVTYVRIRG